MADFSSTKATTTTPTNNNVSPTTVATPAPKDLPKIAQKLIKIKFPISKLTAEQEEEVLKKEWAPKFPTISLFVRWAKKATTNYNSDSLSLLRTIAEQANMHQPIEFLDSVRTYVDVPMTFGMLGFYWWLEPPKQSDITR